LPGGNGRDSGIAGWENMGMGMNSLKWEGIGTINLFPHTSTPDNDSGADTTIIGLLGNADN